MTDGMTKREVEAALARHLRDGRIAGWAIAIPPAPGWEVTLNDGRPVRLTCPGSQTGSDAAEWLAGIETATAGTFTREQVNQAASRAADMIRDELRLAVVDDALANLIVNAVMGVLDDPARDLAGIIDAAYSQPAGEVPSWIGS